MDRRGNFLDFYFEMSEGFWISLPQQFKISIWHMVSTNNHADTDIQPNTQHIIYVLLLPSAETEAWAGIKSVIMTRGVEADTLAAVATLASLYVSVVRRDVTFTFIHLVRNVIGTNQCKLHIYYIEGLIWFEDKLYRKGSCNSDRSMCGLALQQWVKLS